MKKQVLLLLSFISCLTMFAGEISESMAFQKAQQFLQGKQFKQQTLRRAASKSGQGKAYYVFNVENNGGFVIVAGDDRVEPIIGYTTQGNFEDRNLPENFRAWLEQTAAEIEAVKNTPEQTGNAAGPQPTAQRAAIHGAIAPLIITKWNQSSNVFNAHLPRIDGKLPVTGCVATAGAQVMYYYRWPKEPTQVVPGYDDKATSADTKADLPSITFQWDKMKSVYSSIEDGTALTEEEAAVADLMLYCGYAAHMNYGVNESGASTSTLADGMSKYFDYNPNTWKDVSRSNYSISEWDELVYNELANGRPIIYSGSYTGGHAFICDGYDGAGMYHFNWGWGGSYNGYFKLQATNPYGENNTSKMGYIRDNHCIIGLQPSSWPNIEDPNVDDTWDVPTIEGIVASASNVRMEDLKVTMRLYNGNEETYGFGFGIGELNADGTITPIDTKEGYKATDLPKNYGWSSITFDFSSYNLSDGKHTLVPISLLRDESEWRRCKPADIYFEVNVTSGAKSIVAHPVENLQVNKFEMVTGGTPGNYQSILLNITNLGDHLKKYLYLYIGTPEDIGSYASGRQICIASGNTKEYRFTISGKEAGNHTIRLLNSYNGDVVLAQTEITIAQDLRATQFDIGEPRFTNSDIKVNATVENHAGDFATPLYLFAGKSGSKSFAYAAGAAIKSGSSEDITFYFTPTETGTWTIYIATDENGENVIGQTTVAVTEPPTGEVTLKLASSDIKCTGNKATYTMAINNTGGTTNYREIRSWLYVKENDSYQYNSYQATPKVQIGTGETKEVSVTYEGLETGRDYRILLNYFPTFTSTSTAYLSTYYFTFKPAVAGDANTDGEVNVTDIVATVNKIMGQADASFNETAADVNGDGEINVTDIVMMVNIIMSSH
ncbi:MAG: C10 family peptidase [Prevotella sp.]|nr:C10 family peptidase [Prevotella sp.]